MKYNPGNLDLAKSKLKSRVGYVRGTFITDVEKLSDIITNGGQVEVKAQEVRVLGDTNVHMIECKIYFTEPYEPIEQP